MGKGVTVISVLNHLVDAVEAQLDGEIDVAGLASRHGTTEYHVRRMFSSLAGMPLSEYVRRRRMTLAAAHVIDGDELLGIAVRFGYGSTEAFSRAFLAVHGARVADVRAHGGPLRTQPQLRFRLTVEGNTPMNARIVDRPAFRLAGHSARVPLVYEGVNPHIQAVVASIPPEEHARLKALSDTEPAGLLQVSADVEPDAAEGSELTYLHGVALDAATEAPADLDDGTGCNLSVCFKDRPGGIWLAANAWKYGFILRYGDGWHPIVGYTFEPWHYRYVGVDVATDMHEKGIKTLEEYYGLPAAPDYG